MSGCAFGVAPAAADEHDELMAAEQRARVSGSNDSPAAMRWSTQALTLLGAPSSRLSVAKAFDEMPCRLVRPWRSPVGVRCGLDLHLSKRWVTRYGFVE